MIICWGLDTNTHHMMTFSTSHLGQNIYHGCLTHLKSCAGSAQSRLANDANDAVEADFQSSDLNFMNLPFRVACDRKNQPQISSRFQFVCCCLLCLRLPPPGWPETGHFSRAPCRLAGLAGPAPATLEPMHRVNALLVPLWSFTVLLCLPFSMKQNTETKTSENQRLFWAVHCGCGTCLYSRDKSTDSRSCFGLKP